MTGRGERALSEDERARLALLLAAPFPGAEALRAQAARASARDGDVPGVLEFRVPAGLPHADVVAVIPVEAQCVKHGVLVTFALFVYGGQLSSLETLVVPDDRPWLVPSLDELSVYVATADGKRNRWKTGTAPSDFG